MVTKIVTIWSKVSEDRKGAFIRPSCYNFSLPQHLTKELMKLNLEKKIAHGGHPVMRCMADNIFIRTDFAGNIKADKEKSPLRRSKV